ncbi:MAG: PQQ-dependent dehydrogenase, methanol/ethanol family [Polyangiales bacterium]
MEEAESPKTEQVATAGAKGTPEHIRAATARVDDFGIAANSLLTADWPSHGLDYAETRHSRLRQVNNTNVKQLGLAWTYSLGSSRGVEATPVVVDGIMYVTASWSVVHAVNVRTGQRIWSYDPKVPREKGIKGCCDVVNRGVAVYKGKVYVASFDGRLIALDAATGQVRWEKDTIDDKAKPYAANYTITGAPRVLKDKVVIGNGGADYGVRGYVTAYDAETGAQKWRFFTVPGDPSKPFESVALEQAAKTWDPSAKYWEAGGGGTAWDGMAYDPGLNLLYIGTGNGSPWSQKRRSPAGGDNLYLASIVAINPDTGAYVWHYQETPGDNSDFTSTQPIILADLNIQGRQRKALLHAPKNGYFFVIDRTNGKLISAKNYVPVNWSDGYDASGRPIENALTRPDTAFERIPGVLGAHNWMSMSFNPGTGLVYIPAQHIPITLMDDKQWQNGVAIPGRVGSGGGWNTGFVMNSVSPVAPPFGRLVAWDPVAQKEAWKVDHVSPWNGGTLTTAGNLVFQGTADGRFIAFDAKTGQQLWEAPTGSGVIAAPTTYQVDGKQYVSIAVGWGGNYGLYQRASNKTIPGTVFTFVLGGTAPSPEFVDYRQESLLQGIPYKPEEVPQGQALYVAYCVQCHGVPATEKGGAASNLAFVGPGIIQNLDRMIFKGPFSSQGMPDFTGKVKPEEVQYLKAFIQGVADRVRAASAGAAAPKPAN